MTTQNLDRLAALAAVVLPLVLPDERRVLVLDSGTSTLAATVSVSTVPGGLFAGDAAASPAPSSAPGARGVRFRYEYVPPPLGEVDRSPE